MAHECPTCFSACHCGGDIDDATLTAIGGCSHCDSVGVVYGPDSVEPCCPAFPACEHPIPRGDRQAIEEALVAPLFPKEEG